MPKSLYVFPEAGLLSLHSLSTTGANDSVEFSTRLDQYIELLETAGCELVPLKPRGFPFAADDNFGEGYRSRPCGESQYEKAADSTGDFHIPNAKRKKVMHLVTFSKYCF